MKLRKAYAIPLCDFLSFGDPGDMLLAAVTCGLGQLSRVGIRDRSSSSCFFSDVLSLRLEVRVRVREICNKIYTCRVDVKVRVQVKDIYYKTHIVDIKVRFQFKDIYNITCSVDIKVRV